MARPDPRFERAQHDEGFVVSYVKNRAKVWRTELYKNKQSTVRAIEIFLEGRHGDPNEIPILDIDMRKAE